MITPTVGATIDTDGHPGFEARAEGAAAIGGDVARAYLALAPGIGYSERRGELYGTIAPEAGIDLGTLRPENTSAPAMEGDIGVVYKPLIFSDGAQHGFGGVAEVFFATSRSAELVIGPRVEVDYMFPGLGEDGYPLFGLSLAIRYVPFRFAGWD
ncbi:MAG: hypothetical protein U0271_43595 [Polyangiaceae bacterium]